MINKKVAIMYDFDYTLSPDYMQTYSLLPSLNIDTDRFWSDCTELATAQNMDSVLAYMFLILDYARRKNLPIRYEEMKTQGEKVCYYKGVETWFDRINEYGKSMGLEVEHYVISSGLRELIEGTSIADKFKRIFACSFAYDENNNAYWPKQVVNFTTKTQYIYRIRKNVIDRLFDSKEVNEWVADEDKLPYRQMIYVGDGDTDIACMQLMKDKGGTSICVYDPEVLKAHDTAEKLFFDNRVNFVASADYSQDSRMEIIIKNLLRRTCNDIEAMLVQTDLKK